jgi:hypothetical protein
VPNTCLNLLYSLFLYCALALLQRGFPSGRAPFSYTLRLRLRLLSLALFSLVEQDSSFTIITIFQGYYTYPSFATKHPAPAPPRLTPMQ